MMVLCACGDGGLNDFTSGSAYPPDQKGDHDSGVAPYLLPIRKPLEQYSSICLLDLAWSTDRQSAERFWQEKNVGVLNSLLHQTVQVAKAGELEARDLANIAYGAARSVGDK